ncbi:hypothetical protein [Novosphingobium sp. Rr 2-17]|uniref:hypothetical protein n=1 Tax=Novosphingobium sp. Rr 2-17 TaxID=555793 RepID=UPI0012F6B54B|nr:hypothetical protein [Novosphingobium sp. Rr 2-17]
MGLLHLHSRRWLSICDRDDGAPKAERRQYANMNRPNSLIYNGKIVFSGTLHLAINVDFDIALRQFV